MTLTVAEIGLLLVIGLAAGVVGGLIGIGGSIVMIPAMAVLFRDRAWNDQHLFQAAAMVVNGFVAVPATLRHRRARAIRADLFRYMLPATVVSIIAGVLASNLLDGRTLQRIFAVFLAWVVLDTAWKLARRTEDLPESGARVTPARAGAVGGAMGFMAGLLGIGGGNIAVPLAHVLCRLPLKQCIAASSAVMCLTAPVGAAIKVGTLGGHELPWTLALLLAAGLAPTAVAGGFIGAGLVHRLPLGAVRGCFVLVMGYVAGRMGGLW